MIEGPIITVQFGLEGNEVGTWTVFTITPSEVTVKAEETIVFTLSTYLTPAKFLGLKFTGPDGQFTATVSDDGQTITLVDVDTASGDYQYRVGVQYTVVGVLGVPTQTYQAWSDPEIVNKTGGDVVP